MPKPPVISIVDDNGLVREATKRLIKSLGYVPSAFESAEEFLESGRANDSSCLISDVQMRGISGIELQNRLIAQGYRLPIIFITAYPDATTRARALVAGAVGFLSKPVSDEDLILCLGGALKNQAS